MCVCVCVCPLMICGYSMKPIPILHSFYTSHILPKSYNIVRHDARCEIETLLGTSSTACVGLIHLKKNVPRGTSARNTR